MQLSGKFIVFEGPDRGGKSTQANLLRKTLQDAGYDVVLTREPGGTPVAESVRKILLDPANHVTPRAELLLYEASRAQHTEEKILPALADGKIVICERYTMSSCAYQGYGRGIDMEIVNAANDIATRGLKPDLTLVFLMSDKYFLKRGESLFSDRLELEKDEFRNKMREGYKQLVKKTPNAVFIDADNSVEEIHAKVLAYLKEYKIV